MEISKEQLLFSRGEGGSLIPQEIELDEIEGKPTVKVIPLTRGKLQEVHVKALSTDIKEQIESDNEVIKSGLISPVLTDEEILDLKPNMALAITKVILSISLGISQDKITKKAKEVIAEQEFELKKK